MSCSCSQPSLLLSVSLLVEGGICWWCHSSHFCRIFTVCFQSLLPAYIADMPGKNLTMVKKAQMVTMYKKGKSMTKIAKELGVSKTTVSIWCNRARDGDLETARKTTYNSSSLTLSLSQPQQDNKLRLV